HASGDTVAFQYGADRSRYVKVITEGGVQKTLHYAGPEFEVALLLRSRREPRAARRLARAPNQITTSSAGSRKL
ncbi:MAG TPA: hypothetical protein VFV10_03895, partial [Gammaproteobacteria bacterium]|nr:hypothetical protein [Gammaproteobacteria bacterium]